MVSQLIFKSFTHLEFIFMYGIIWWLGFIFFLHVTVQISKHHLLKRLFLLHFMHLPPLLNINGPQRLGFISGLYVLLHWSMCLFLCQYQTVLITVIQFDVRYGDPSFFVVLSKNYCCSLRSFMVPQKFQKCLLYICEICP